MTELSFTDERMDNADGGLWLCLKVTDPAAARRFCMAQNKEGIVYDVEIKEHRETRSLTANSYLWHLLGQAADALRTTKEELYLDYIRKYGIFKDFTLPEDQTKTFCVAWSKQGIGWPTERVDYADGGITTRAYYGSSSYNTKQMSRLIDAVVEDAKEIGIETLPPEKLALLMEEWK